MMASFSRDSSDSSFLFSVSAIRGLAVRLLTRPLWTRITSLRSRVHLDTSSLVISSFSFALDWLSAIVVWVSGVSCVLYVNVSVMITTKLYSWTVDKSGVGTLLDTLRPLGMTFRLYSMRMNGNLYHIVELSGWGKQLRDDDQRREIRNG